MDNVMWAARSGPYMCVFVLEIKEVWLHACAPNDFACKAKSSFELCWKTVLLLFLIYTVML